MKKVVTVGNKTGLPQDTEIFVDGKKLPLSHMMSVDITVRPDELVVANVSLKVDELNVLTELNDRD